ncbi:hypothetical protein JQK19_12150 [Chromobacterium violaceum]|uniref:hypothetical protein n=1 Tax=Chromobacterium violaceum TaxID=536 RepID=UPI001B32AA35|nr:hypothetical protein [Chromobacterium violaceum]MBP4045076.1 hypothetical protein [Chromobacterium violaceum]MBT2867991.1 hypothetical protein [Chromobacterium violaceum]
MAPFPTPVTQVRVYPYIPDSPIVVPPVFTGGSGTYSVGTLTTNIFYNLDLASGEAVHGGPHAGNKYYAVCKDAAGKEFTTPWMTCLKGGPQPQFGRTTHLLHPTHGTGAGSDADAGQAVASPDIAYQIHLTDVSVNAYVPPTEPLLIPLIEGGKGIATFAGLLPGGTWSVSVAGGERVNPLHAGMTATITGTNVATGRPFHIPAVFVTKEAGDPAIFVQLRHPHEN